MSEQSDYDEIKRVENYLYLVGKTFRFEDGDKIEIVQIKRRDTGLVVTYHVFQGPGIPRKLVMSLEDFLETYGHLFN